MMKLQTAETLEGRLPTFLIIGMAKSGTSSVYAYLRGHPQVFLSPVRTPNFFGLGEQHEIRCGGPVKHFGAKTSTLAQYQRLFAAAQNEIALGEGSSFFNFTPRAAQRIRHYIPDARLIAILRQPAERAYSQYLYARWLGWEHSSSFADALGDEPKRLAEQWFPFLRYRESSLYADRLLAFYDAFPRAQIRVYLFDDLRRDTAGLMRDIFTFLGVDPGFVPNVSVKHNPSRVKRFPWLRNRAALRSRRLVPQWLRSGLARLLSEFPDQAPPPLDPVLRGRLTAEFRSDILRTQTMIEKDLSCWLSRD
jgi:hypothetical protein